MNEECTNARGICHWIEFSIVASRVMIAAEKCFAFAPAAAADDLAVKLDDEISSIANQLSIHAEDRAKRGIHLRNGIIRRLQSVNRERDQLLQRGNVIFVREPQFPILFQ